MFSFLFNQIDSDQQEDLFFGLGTWIAESWNRCSRVRIVQRVNLLLGIGTFDRTDADMIDEAKRLVLELDHDVLPIQGPPGAGKTYTGARMICELVRKRKKVGITAMSHKVIRKLLDEV